MGSKVVWVDFEELVVIFLREFLGEVSGEGFVFEVLRRVRNIIF